MTAKIYTIRASKAAQDERNALLEQAREVGDMLARPLFGNTRIDLGIAYLLVHSRLDELEASL